MPTPPDQMRMRLRRAGKISFWVQAAIGVLSGIFWLVVLAAQIANGIQSFGSTIALWATLATLLTLAGNCLLTFRYWRGAETSRLKIVLYVSLIGAFVALISSAAQIGDLLSSLIFRQVLVARQEEWGLLLATINTNITLAHLSSLTAVLWIYGVLDRDRKSSR
ncbi:DUF3611 family protein [Synechococcus sp. PCC 7336]|uniref:DUF3611 family protein n=1 Tax=Synechococcus sp. PCC 7336 TaxID=195250 RepID=UPI000345836A|nr:DUF3611 family protein [Synechococcus sp. PCC 7336]